MLIIGLCGKRQSGKDTFAGYGAAHATGQNRKAAITSFASPIKKFVRDYCGVDMRLLDGTNEEKNTVVGNWGQFFNKEICEKYDQFSSSPVTARQLLQVYGTDIFRNVNPNFWVDLLESRISRNEYDEYDAAGEPDFVFVTDVRFQNEVEKIRDLGGIVIKLDRGQFTDTHASEAAIDKIPEELFDAICSSDDLYNLQAVKSIACETIEAF